MGIKFAGLYNKLRSEVTVYIQRIFSCHEKTAQCSKYDVYHPSLSRVSLLKGQTDSWSYK